MNEDTYLKLNYLRHKFKKRTQEWEEHSYTTNIKWKELWRFEVFCSYFTAGPWKNCT